ncbi:PAS domain-containing protein [Sphingopyxis sp. DBS4]|uniref:PAS domain-containing protein n=1 Tax=Sphingopyxis sp. DBS4 TaxID=2968500 RepID=UPI00214B183A|nr:PAS domain-containing protein [Sphingopyxis sp. DBS4]
MARTGETQRVSAADFIRGFGNWRLQAARRPVVVTHHGKDAHVLISLDDYRRLGDADMPSSSLRDSLADLVESIRDAVLLIDRERRIAAVNPAASDMLETAAAELIGRPLADAVPALASHLLLAHVNRLLDHRERFAGDVPGLLRPRQWLRVELVPLPVGGAILLRDISAAMDEQRVGDTRRAFVDAAEAHGAIGRASISVREAIEDANGALTAMVGVDPIAIRRVRFSAMIAMGERAAFLDALETLFRTGAPARLISALVTREGTALPVTLAMAERRGAYASEGAVVVVTKAG